MGVKINHSRSIVTAGLAVGNAAGLLRPGRALHLPLLALGLLLLTGCQRGCSSDDAVRVYQAPKDPGAVAQGPAAPAMGSPTASGTAHEGPIHYTLAEGWKSMGPSNMASDVIQVGDDPKVLLTVTPLGATGGGVAGNINRWEGQLGLAPTPEANFGKVATPIKVDGQEGHLIDLVGPNPAKDGGAPQRMLAAILPGAGRTWFFKLTGPAEKLAPQKDKFDAFIKGIHFHGADAAAPAQPPAQGQAALPSGHPPIGGASAMPGATAGTPNPHAQEPPAAAAGEAKIEGLASYKLPAGWVIDPKPRMMRAGTIYVGEGDQRAELVISVLAAKGFGGWQANMDRWRGQVGLPPSNDEKAHPAQTIKLDKGPIQVRDFEGPEGEGRKRQIVAMSEFPDAPQAWFFRLIGPHATVTKARPDFEAFLKSLKFAE